MAHQIIVSDEVFASLTSIIAYLEAKWSKKVAENFLLIFYNKVEAIVLNPSIGRKSEKDPSIRKILITKHNLL